MSLLFWPFQEKAGSAIKVIGTIADDVGMLLSEVGQSNKILKLLKLGHKTLK